MSCMRLALISNTVNAMPSDSAAGGDHKGAVN